MWGGGLKRDGLKCNREVLFICCAAFHLLKNKYKWAHFWRRIMWVYYWNDRRERSSSASQRLTHSSTSSWWNLDITDLPRPPWRHQQRVSEGRAQQWTVRSSLVKNIHPLYILSPASFPSDKYMLAGKRALLLASLKNRSHRWEKSKWRAVSRVSICPPEMEGGDIILIEIPTSASLIQ